jgi:D,D-heptose 1,7-bisphosphate phosphatase
MRPAVFLDRDGTINVEVNYLSSPEQMQLIDGVPAAIQRLRDAGFAIIVVTNQSGVARGYLTAETLDAIHHKLHTELAAAGTRVDGIYFCAHHPDENCNCRKPKSGLFLQAAREHNLDLRASLMIGDAESDLLAAKNLQMPSILVRTGHGAARLARIAAWTDYQPSYIADDLRDAVNWLIAHGK